MYMLRRSRNRVTVPAKLVKKLNLMPGSLVAVETSDGAEIASVKVDKYYNARFHMNGHSDAYDVFADLVENIILVSD